MWATLGNLFQKKPKQPYLIPLEKALLKVIGETLPAEVRQVFANQVALIGDGYREKGSLWFRPPPANFFTRVDISNMAWPPNARFANGEARELVRIGFKVDDTTYLMRSFSKDHAISELVVRPNPEAIYNRDDLQILNTRLINDPRTPVPELKFHARGPHEPGRPIEPWQWEPGLTGHVAEWAGKVQLEPSMLPYSPEAIEYYTKGIEAKLPEDYLELIRQGSTFYGKEANADISAQWTVSDPDTVWEFHYPDADFYCLFNRGAWMLGVLWNDFSGQIYRVQAKPYQRDAVGETSLWKAIEKELQRPYTPDVI